jgi:hypothetical protein
MKAKRRGRKVPRRKLRIKDSLRQFLPPVSRISFGIPSKWRATLEEKPSTVDTGTVRKSS